MTGPAAAILDACRAGQWTAALALAQQALARGDVDRGHLHALIGKIAWQLGDRALARDHLEAAVDRGADDPTTWGLLADLSDHRPDRRVQLLARAAAHPRGGGTYAVALGRALAEMGRNDEALRWLARAADDAATAGEALALLAELAVQTGDIELAGEAVEQFDALDPAADPRLLAPCAAALAGQLGDSPAFDRVLDRLFDSGFARAEVCKWRALRCVTLRVPADAAQWARQAVQANPADDDARRLLAECQLLAGDVTGAATVLQQSADLPVTTALAMADSLRQRGDVADALRWVEPLRDAHPDHPGVWLELGRLYEDLGRQADAEAAIARAMAIDGRIDAEAGKSVEFLRHALQQLPALCLRLGVGGPLNVVRLRMGHNALLVQLADDAGRQWYAKGTLPGRREFGHVAATADLEAWLAEQAELPVHVPLPLADEQGARVGALAGGWATVSAAVPGLSLRRSLAQPRLKLTTEHARSLGETLAALHRGLALNAGWQRAPTGLSSAIGPVLRLGRDGQAWPRLRAQLGLHGAGQSAGDAIERQLELWLPRAQEAADRMPAGIIHGDFGWHNCNWLGHRAVAVVDFDYACRDFPLGDLAQAVARSGADWKRLANHRDPDARRDVAQALIAGYEGLAGPLPVDREGLLAVVAATRLAYGLSLAAAAQQIADPRSPAGYGPALDSVQLLVWQMAWLAEHGLGWLRAD